MKAMPTETGLSGGCFVFRRALANELLKLVARPRTYIGFGVFLALEVLILTMLRLPRPQAAFRRLLEENGYLFAEYFSGPTLAVAMIAAAGIFLGALYLALVSGDIVAKEAEDGTLRMILNRPISRLQLLVVKWISCLVYTLSLVAFLGLSGVLMGILFQGWGGLFVFSPIHSVFGVFPPWEGLMRLALGLLVLGLFLCTVSSIGFFFSCLPVKPAAATVLTLSIVFADFVLQNLPYFSDYQHLFMTYHIGQWIIVFKHPLPIYELSQSLISLWSVNLTFLILSVAYFSQRDFKG